MLPALYIASFGILVMVWNVALPVEFVKIYGVDAPKLWDTLRLSFSMLVICANYMITLRAARWITRGV